MPDKDKATQQAVEQPTTVARDSTTSDTSDHNTSRPETELNEQAQIDLLFENAARPESNQTNDLDNNPDRTDSLAEISNEPTAPDSFDQIRAASLAELAKVDSLVSDIQQPENSIPDIRQAPEQADDSADIAATNSSDAANEITEPVQPDDDKQTQPAATVSNKESPTTDIEDAAVNHLTSKDVDDPEAASYVDQTLFDKFDKAVDAAAAESNVTESATAATAAINPEKSISEQADIDALFAPDSSDFQIDLATAQPDSDSIDDDEAYLDQMMRGKQQDQDSPSSTDSDAAAQQPIITDEPILTNQDLDQETNFPEPETPRYQDIGDKIAEKIKLTVNKPIPPSQDNSKTASWYGEEQATDSQPSASDSAVAKPENIPPPEPENVISTDAEAKIDQEQLARDWEQSILAENEATKVNDKAEPVIEQSKSKTTKEAQNVEPAAGADSLSNEQEASDKDDRNSSIMQELFYPGFEHEKPAAESITNRSDSGIDKEFAGKATAIARENDNGSGNLFVKLASLKSKLFRPKTESIDARIRQQSAKIQIDLKKAPEAVKPPPPQPDEQPPAAAAFTDQLQQTEDTDETDIKPAIKPEIEPEIEQDIEPGTATNEPVTPVAGTVAGKLAQRRREMVKVLEANEQELVAETARESKKRQERIKQEYKLSLAKYRRTKIFTQSLKLLISYGIMFATVFLITKTLIVQKSNVINFVPEAAILYQQLGIPSYAPGQNISLQQPNIALIPEVNDQLIIKLRGAVSNDKAQQSASVPNLLVLVRNFEGAVIDQWEIPLPATTIAPGESLEYIDEKALSPGAEEILIGFRLDGVRLTQEHKYFTY